MKKIDFIRMWQDRINDGEATYSQLELITLLDALSDTMTDAFDYLMEVGESLKLSDNVRLSVKKKNGRVLSAKTLRNIKTGEPIEIKEQTIPARKYMAIHGLEKDI